MKYYAPQHKLAPKDNMETSDSSCMVCASVRAIIHSLTLCVCTVYIISDVKLLNIYVCAIMLLYYTKCQSWKRKIIQPNIHRILPQVNQVIYTLDTIKGSSLGDMVTPDEHH